MPDAASIATALAAPGVAGIVAVVIHRQRLGHERHQADLATARELLARGAELGMQLERAARAWFHSVSRDPISGAVRVPERRAFTEAAEAWAVYLATVEVMFDADHPVLRATQAVDEHVSDVSFEMANADDMVEATDVAHPVLHQLGLCLGEWRAAARAVGRATLPPMKTAPEDGERGRSRRTV